MKGDIEEITHLFGSDIPPVLFSGGQGGTYRSGDVVLKPTNNLDESNELAELAAQYGHSSQLRIPQPVRSKNGKWVEDGFVAWEYLEGEHLKGAYERKLAVCDWFSDAFAAAPKPKFIVKRNDAWAVADRVVWEQEKASYEDSLQLVIDEIKQHLTPVGLPEQIIHGDINGNIIFDEEGGFGVIDLTIYWRPRDFAKALLVVDALTLENASEDIHSLISELPEIKQLLLRAGMRRIVENAEHVHRGYKDKGRALSEAKRYLDSLNRLCLVG